MILLWLFDISNGFRFTKNQQDSGVQGQWFMPSPMIDYCSQNFWSKYFHFLYHFCHLLFSFCFAIVNIETYSGSLFKFCQIDHIFTGTKISESTYSVFLFSMDFGWGPSCRSFLTSTASALTMRSIWEVQGASHDPGGGVDTTAVLAGNSNL